MPEQPESNLDFSMFHPSDHWPWEPRCREFYGGWRYHIKIAWTYRWKPEIRWWAWRPYYLIACRLGFHSWETWWRRDKGYTTLCEYCLVHRETLDNEKWDLPPGIE